MFPPVSTSNILLYLNIKIRRNYPKGFCTVLHGGPLVPFRPIDEAIDLPGFLGRWSYYLKRWGIFPQQFRIPPFMHDDK